jgi:glycosyltransferase involved in cell wall biosynthesis
MRIAHFSVFSPNQSGMYATVADMIRAERMQGIEAEFVDYGTDADGNIYSKVGLVDGDIVSISPDWAYKNADILVRHSMIVEPIAKVGIPMIMAMHGRPEYSFMLEHYNKSPVMSIMCNHETDSKYAAYISFWKEHQLFWSLIMPKRKIDYIPPVVDLKKYSPDGEKYSFDKWSGCPNILVADLWREDITPFNAIVAAALFREKYVQGTKVHIFGLPPAGKGFTSQYAERLRAAGVVGEANVMVPFMDQVYRTADMLVTPHKIATRVIRESLASGLPIVAGSSCPYSEYTADVNNQEAFAHQINRCWTALKINRKEMKAAARKTAEKEFGFENMGKVMLNLCNEILVQKRDSECLPIEWSGWSIDPTDWVVLRDVLKEKNIKKVVEFGSGVSTQLMDRLGIEVHSYETDPIHLEKIKRLVSKSTFILWNGLYPPSLADYDMALIDGPFGGENREPSYKAVAESKISIVACHDYKRKEDKVWIDKYFSKWKVLAKADESIAGLLILKREQ